MRLMGSFSTGGVLLGTIMLVPDLNNRVTALRRIPSFPVSSHEEGESAGRRRTDEANENVVPDSGERGTKAFHHDSRNKDLPTPEDHLVQSMPYLQEGTFPTRHYAGHLPASPGTNKRLFYWLFEPAVGGAETATSSNVPLILWLNGGPGCSSMDGLWIENGPFRLQPNGKGKEPRWRIDIHDQSWHTLPAWLLYVDQPVGTGLSFTREKTYCGNDEQVNQDFHYFLRQFFTVYASLLGVEDDDADGSTFKRVTRPFYFSGESHAGHYIPSMMDYILQRNDEYIAGKAKEQLPPGPKMVIPIGGAAIGNGWVDPYYQYAAAEAAYGMSLIGEAQKAHMDTLEEDCQRFLKKGDYHESVCFHLLDNVVGASFGRKSSFKVSQYDSRKVERRHGPRNFPPGHKNVEAYLGGLTTKVIPAMDIQMQDVLESIHAQEILETDQTYLECTDPPYYALSHQDGKGVVEELVRVLDHPTRPKILFFNGVNDLICNHVGNEEFLIHLPWSQRHEWVVANRFAWDGGSATAVDLHGKEMQIAGYAKQHRNLAFLKVLESGHMVPMDQPDVSLEMMRILVHDFESGFSSSQQEISRDDDLTTDCPTCATCPELHASKTSLDVESPWKTSPPSPSDGNASWLVVSMTIGGCFLLLVGIYAMCQRRQQQQQQKQLLYRNDGEIALVPYRDDVGSADDDFDDDDDDDDEYEEIEEEAE